jgi:L-ribulose-5-phosphate 4-epimerase
MSQYSKIKEECCSANVLLPEKGLVDLTFGNVSVIDRDRGVFAIKPSGVDYRDLSPEDMVIVDLEGNVLEGNLNPSSDTPTHRRLYRAFRGVGAIVHTHSRNATAFAQAGLPIPCIGTTHADYFCGAVPVTRLMTSREVLGDYEWETGNVIVERFAELDPALMFAVLVRGHGSFVWGASAVKAVENAQALEIAAEMALKAMQLNPHVQPIPMHLLIRHFHRKHGPKSYYGQAKRGLFVQPNTLSTSQSVNTPAGTTI